MLLLTETWDPAQAEGILKRVNSAVARADRGHYSEAAEIDIKGQDGWNKRLTAWDPDRGLRLHYSSGEFHLIYAATAQDMLEVLTMLVRPGDALSVHTGVKPSGGYTLRDFWQLKQLVKKQVDARPWGMAYSLGGVPYGPDRLADDASLAGVDPEQAVYLASNLLPRPPVRRAYSFAQIQGLLQQGAPRSPGSGLPFTVHDVRRLAAANVQKAAARLAPR